MLRRQKSVHRTSARVFNAVGVVFFLAIILTPFLMQLSVSLKTARELFSFPTSFIPQDVAWENFLKVWEIIPLTQVYRNTYFVIAMALLLNFVIAVPTAYAFSCLRFPFKKLIMSLAFISQMFVPVLVVVPIFNLMKRLQLIDSLWALVLTGMAFSVSFVVLLMKGFFDTIPREVLEAAAIDGCGEFNVMLRICLPICTSGVVVAIIYSAILVNNEFLFANTLISSVDKNVMSVALCKLIKANPYEAVTWNYVMACAFYAGLPIQIAFLFIRKYLATGLTAGAIK